MVSLDHLVRQAEEGFRDWQPERLGRLEVDYQLGLFGTLHGQILKLTK